MTNDDFLQVFDFCALHPNGLQVFGKAELLPRLLECLVPSSAELGFGDKPAHGHDLLDHRPGLGRLADDHHGGRDGQSDSEPSDWQSRYELPSSGLPESLPRLEEPAAPKRARRAKYLEEYDSDPPIVLLGRAAVERARQLQQAHDAEASRLAQTSSERSARTSAEPAAKRSGAAKAARPKKASSRQRVRK